jgi:hypothetical protein
MTPNPAELNQERFATILESLILPGRFIQMSPALDGRALETVGPSAELTGDRLRLCFEI